MIYSDIKGVNFMKRTLALLIGLFVLSWPAFGQFQVVELAHEVPLSEFVVPVTRNGNLTFRSCSDCKSFTVRMTPETRYIINDRDVDLREFRERVIPLGRSSTKYLTILHHLEKDTVSFISISIR